jgi:integration host factor subunit beta
MLPFSRGVVKALAETNGHSGLGEPRLVTRAAGKLTKAELSKEIARTCGSSVREARKLLEIILTSMTQALSRGERIEIREFGSFGTRVRKTRMGRNPKTGAAVKVLPKRVPYFRASKQLRALL